MSKAEVSLAAVARLAIDLGRYAELASGLRLQLEFDARATREKADGILRERTKDSEAAEANLASARRMNEARLQDARASDSGPPRLIDLDPLLAAVDRTRRALDHAEECRRAIDVELNDADGRVAAYNGAVGVVVAGATALLHRKYGDLRQYLAGAAAASSQSGEGGVVRGAGALGGATVGGPSGGGAGSVGCHPERPELLTPPGVSPGFAVVPLALVDDSDSTVSGPEDFGKGYSISDLEWAHDAFLDVVLPTLGNGGTMDDLRARDAAEGRVGTRSYSDTCSGFLGGDAIRLSWKGDRLELQNGRHRFWVARRMGLASVVAEVVGRA